MGSSEADYEIWTGPGDKEAADSRKLKNVLMLNAQKFVNICYLVLHEKHC